MRSEELKIDHSVEHSFDPSELFDMCSMWDHFRVPIGFLRSLTEAKTLTEAIDSTTSCLHHAMNVERASVAISNGHGLLQIWAQSGAKFARLDKSVSARSGRIGRAFQTGRLVISADLNLCTEPDSVALSQSGYRRAINAPILFSGECIGTMNVCTRDVDGLGIREAFSLQCVSSYLAPTIAVLRKLDATLDEFAEVEAMKEQAEHDSAAKSFFIAHVSHEIRTPMNAIMGMAQILATEDLTPQQAEKVDTMLYSARHLIAILNDVLDLSKIEAGRLEMNPVRHSPEEVLTRTVDIWRDRASQRGNTLSLFLEPGLPGSAIFDAVRVQQCLSNLISNAIKFTEQGQVRVFVSTDSAADETIFSVTVEDTGAGIPADELGRLFEPFSQGKASAGGTGLGLTICRKLAELLKGSLTARSVVGQGSQFTFTFRAGYCSQESQREAPVPAAPPALEDCGQLPDGLRILLVEDVPTNRMVVRAMLKGFGVEVLEAENGKAGLEVLRERSVDIVLLDMNMPVMDGRGFISALRAWDGPVGRLPVIALTADAMSGDRERYLKLGINGYLPKPLDRDALIAEIAETVSIFPPSRSDD